jgi:alkanesulfonate monooxygenase SsuD/methylene tetrahydromethanopterin reductase-like flavin-dependent oxidoreductase (luciferase family)
MVRVAGALADGVVTWLAGPRTLGEHIVPALREAARERPEPRVVAGVPVAVVDDPAEGHAAAQPRFGGYGNLENYRRQLDREGVDSVAELAVVGDEPAVCEQLRHYAEEGMTELWPVVFPVGEDPAASIARTRKLLVELAAEV